MHNFQNSNSLERKVGICKRAEDTIVLVIRVVYAQWWHWELPAVISLHHQQLWTLIIYWHLGIQQCQSRTGMFTYTAQTTKSNKCFEESKKKTVSFAPITTPSGSVLRERSSQLTAPMVQSEIRVNKPWAPQMSGMQSKKLISSMSI